MRENRRRILWLAGFGGLVCLLLLALPGRLFSQDNQKEPSYTVREGRMYINLKKNIDKAQLDRFIDQYDLSDLDLAKLIFGHSGEEIKQQLYKRLQKMGWRVDTDNRQKIVLSKQMLGMSNLNDPAQIIRLTEDHPNTYDLFPAQNDNLVFGFNRFTGKFPFAVKDSLVTFYAKGHTSARRVLLAGSFTNWQQIGRAHV